LEPEKEICGKERQVFIRAKQKMPSSPPISELGLTVQFPKLGSVTVLDAAKLYEQFRDRFPLLQQVARAAPMQLAPVAAPGIHVAAAAGIQFITDDGSSLPRLWMITSDSRRLIQFQDDRISFNWRRIEPFGEEITYPGYIALKAEFLSIYSEFQRWCEERLKTRPQPEAGELLYQNTFPLAGPTGDKRISEIFGIYTPNRRKKVAGFNMGWMEQLEGATPGVVTMQASAGSLPDGSSVAQLSIVSKVNLTAVSNEPDKWFDLAHERTLEIFAEATISSAKRDNP
jgi:uncharacterized protein (TIGR04255 family)